MCRLEDEKKARKELGKDVDDLKKTIEDTKLNHKQTQKETDLVKEELDRLKQEHKEVRQEGKTQNNLMKYHCKITEANLLLWLLQEVDALCDKIKDSDVKVEIDSPNTNLAEVLNKVRGQYEKLAKKNLKETEDWYQNKVHYLLHLRVQSLFCVPSLHLLPLFCLSHTISISFSFCSLTTSRWWRPKTRRSCSLERWSSRICSNKNKLLKFRSRVCTAR